VYWRCVVVRNRRNFQGVVGQNVQENSDKTVVARSFTFCQIAKPTSRRAFMARFGNSARSCSSSVSYSKLLKELMAFVSPKVNLPKTIFHLLTDSWSTIGYLQSMGTNRTLAVPITEACYAGLWKP